MTNWTEYFRIQQSMSFPAVTVFISLHNAVSALVIITGCQSQTAGCWQNLANILHLLNQDGTVHLYWYWQEETYLVVSSQWAAESCGVCGGDISVAHRENVSWVYWSARLIRFYRDHQTNVFTLYTDRCPIKRSTCSYNACYSGKLPSGCHLTHTTHPNMVQA